MRLRSSSGFDMRAEHPGADAGQVLRFRWVSTQAIQDPLLQIIFAGWDQFRFSGNFGPNASAAGISQHIGPVAKNHGPYRGKKIELGRILREIAANGVQGLVNG